MTSLTLTNMRYIGGWVESLVLRRKARDFFHISVEKKEQSGKPCDILYIVKLDDSRESVFLIHDMFLITEEYIEREYTIAGNHLMMTSEHTAKVIEQKARKVLGMLKRGVKFMPTQPKQKNSFSGSIFALLLNYY